MDLIVQNSYDKVTVPKRIETVQDSKFEESQYKLVKTKRLL